ncbi:MAG: 5'-Nucleotidase domain protein [Ignavibacteriae bacterium]|nr:MAG: 5'-Nucleotidase domain protein [Ignavibacteriota bacterium]
MKKLLFVFLTLLIFVFLQSFSQVLHNDVIINEFTVNPAEGKEYVELLVVKAGGVDLRGFRLSDVGTKGGTTTTAEGHLDFPNETYLSNLQRGTRIVCVLATPSANSVQFTQDTDPSDGVLILFSSDITGGVLTATGTLDLSTNENIQFLNGPGTDATTIDFVAQGTNTSSSNFSDATWVQSGAPSASSNTVQYFTNNSGTGLNNDTAAVGWLWNRPITEGTPGQKNLGQIFPWATVVDGDGSASLVNDAGGTLNGSQIFQRNSAGQVVKITVTGVGTGLLDKVRLTVPSDFTGFSGSNVTLGGAFAGKSTSIVGNQITVLNAALGTTPGTITISNLTSPNPVGASINGNSTWLVETATASGTLTPIAVSPKSYTIIPISNIKTGGVDGYGNSDAGNTPVMNGQIVAVSGVATIEHQVLNTASYTSFYIQEGTYGLQVFRSASPVVTWVRGDQLILRGTIGQYNGGMQIVPLSGTSPDFFNLGAGTMPSPLILTNASDITEQYEGRLIQLNNATFDSAGQTFIGSAVDRGMNNCRTSAVDTGTLFIHASNTAVVGKTIPPSANIVGVVHQRNDIIGAGQTKYKIAIRNLADLGLNPADGSGTATISPTLQYVGSTSLTQTIVLKGDGVNTIEGMSVTIPSSWTWTGSPVDAQISGPGFASASMSVSGDGSSGNPWVITLSGAAVTNVDTGIIAISNLTAPSVTGATTFIVKTRGAGGTLNAIGVQPAVTIILPPAPLPLVEIFDYTPGENLTNFGWTAHSGAGTNPIKINENPLTYSDYIHSGVGRSVTLTTTGEDVNRGFESVNSGSIYASFMVKFDTALAAAEYFFHLSPANVPTTHIARIYFRKDASNNIAFGVTKGAAPDTGWTPFNYSMGTTYLCVLKYTFNTGSNTDDEIKLWINPDLSGGEPTADITYTTTTTDPSNLGTVALRQGSGNAKPTVTIGGLRIATTWISTSSTSMNILYNQGWNMVSVPLVVSDYRKSIVFPTAVSSAFAFDNGYITKDTLKNGVGYWLKFAVNQNVSMEGSPRISDSVNVKQGWNMIGTLSVPILTSQVTPGAGITIASQFYAYLNGYQISDTLKPGKAYWVKVSNNGKLYLNSTLKYSKPNNSLMERINGLNKITVKDALGYVQTLYFGKDEELKSNLDYFELPPSAPADVFDVRYQSNRIVEIHSSNTDAIESYPISISGAVYPLVIEWDVTNFDGIVYELNQINESGSKNNLTLNRSGSIKITDENVVKLELKAGGQNLIPKEFSLSQNYPNPFNPSTRMTISLPKDAYVKMSIYDILGREVALLVDKQMEAGTHQVEFNVNSQNMLPSGIYFVKLSAKTTDNNNFNFVRKITFLK